MRLIGLSLWALGICVGGCTTESADSSAPGGAAGEAGSAGAYAGGAGGLAGAGGISAAGSGGAAGAAGVAGGSAGQVAGGAAGEGSGGVAGAAGAGACDGASPFVIRAVSHEFGAGQTFGQSDFPSNVLGPPRGGGCCGGSLDVVSLGVGGVVVLEMGDTIVDGPGVDLLVFENAFEYGSGNIFAEPASVSVSLDGEAWHTFPCDALSAPWGACAGTHPVYANAAENDLDPTDPTQAGGDGYDLADVGLSAARFVRVEDRADLTSSVFDLDAIAVVNGTCSGPR